MGLKWFSPKYLKDSNHEELTFRIWALENHLGPPKKDFRRIPVDVSIEGGAVVIKSNYQNILLQYLPEGRSGVPDEGNARLSRTKNDGVDEITIKTSFYCGGRENPRAEFRYRVYRSRQKIKKVEAEN